MTPQEQERRIQCLRDTGVGNTVSEELMNQYPVQKTEDCMIPTRNGETHVYISYPCSEQHLYPLFVNIHGGGFIKGHRQQDTVFSKNICCNSGCVVLDIDYTPAPEQKYPYALHQCYDVLQYVVTHAAQMKIDPSKIALCGHSAGGNLVAGITLINNQTKEFTISLQILDYPALDLYTPPQLKKNAYKNPRIPPETARLYNSVYVDDELRLEPTVSPLFAPNEMLEGLPKALVMTCGDDSLAEEAEKYAYRLIEAGVPVTARRFLNSNHGFVVRRAEEFEKAQAMIFNELRCIFP